MENKLEQLLNGLIKKGWMPRNKNYTKIKVVIKIKIVRGDIQINRGDENIPEDERYWGVLYKSKRELVSKESGLWQFVCENKMEKKMEKNHRGIWINSWAKSAYQSYPLYTMERYEYRIIESSLKDESELEDFLLSNIIIKNEK